MEFVFLTSVLKFGSHFGLRKNERLLLLIYIFIYGKSGVYI